MEFMHDEAGSSIPRSELTGAPESEQAETHQGADPKTEEPGSSERFSVDDPVETPSSAPSLPYMVVGVGASAGGVEAYIGLLKNLPRDTGSAYVLVSHLAPGQKSHLVEILARHTKMGVKLIEHEAIPQPNHVYVLPPDHLVSMSEGKLLLESRLDRSPPFVIDFFFRSLASDQKYRAVGVVLSGMDSDGALGLLAIKGEGGVSIVQTPESARYPSMPESSLAADHVDAVVPPAEIGIELARLAKRFSDPAVQALEEDQAAADQKQEIARILKLLTGVSGIDYRHYKSGTIQRRISRGMVVKRIENLAEYARYLQTHPEELKSLHENTLIGVTRFFRDPDVFSVLQRNVLTPVLKNRASGQQIRIWIAGCSTGEEVYSIAMSLIEVLHREDAEPAIQIFGTDASEKSIQRARTGIYPDTIAGDVSTERLRRFFVKVDKGYQVSKRVRDLCIFARQNLCTDPPFSHLDLVSCRNVLIYLDKNLQNRIIPAFHYALRPSGFLLIGNSETIRDFETIFAHFDRKHKIYRKQGQQSYTRFNLDASRLVPDAVGKPVLIPKRELNPGTHSDLRNATDRAILAAHSPAGAVIDDEMEIVEFRGRTAPYLEMAPGLPSTHLMKVVREDLSGHVHTAIRQAIDTGALSRVTTSFQSGAATCGVIIEAMPLHSFDSARPHYLVLFLPQSPELEAARQPDMGVERDQLLAQARSDLAANRRYSQALLDEREAANQELVSANEEIQSANEELQSANEELETTKEELQSANEELQTVNEELQQRNGSLSQTSNDLTNLLHSVNIPVLMLSNELHIRQFTPVAERLMNVRASDIGRPIGELRLGLSIENLEPILRQVLDSLGTREKEVKDRDGRWRLLRIRPYRTVDNKIEGVVMTLFDIDELRQSQQNLRDARDFSQAVVEGSHVPLAILNMDLKVVSVNAAFRALSRLSDNDLKGRSFPELVNLLWRMGSIAGHLEKLCSYPDDAAEFEYRHDMTINADKLFFRVWGRAIRTDGHHVLLVTVEDITQQARAEQLMEQLNERLQEQIREQEIQLDKNQTDLRLLTANLFTSQEDERRRIARELHDDVTQRLAVLQMDLDCLRDSPLEDREEMIRSIDKVRDKTFQLSEDVRGISHQLHPAILDDLGLPAALRELTADFEEREDMPTTFFGQNLPDSIPMPIAGALYRVAQEALRNVAKHAGRTHVKVVLEQTDSVLRLQITDSGEGFDLSEKRKGLGMISMAERARMVQGTFSVESARRVGTTMKVDVPLPSHLEGK